MELTSEVGLCTEKRISKKKKEKKDHISDYPAAASVLMLFGENFQKDKKWLLLLLSHIYIPTGHRVISKCWLLLSSAVDKKQTKGRRRRYGNVAGRRRETKKVNGKAYVCWTETCRRGNGKSMSLLHLKGDCVSNSGGFYSQFVVERLMFRCETGLGWRVWRSLNVCFQNGGMDARKGKSQKERSRGWEEMQHSGWKCTPSSLLS